MAILEQIRVRFRLCTSAVVLTAWILSFTRVFICQQFPVPFYEQVNLSLISDFKCSMDDWRANGFARVSFGDLASRGFRLPDPLRALPGVVVQPNDYVLIKSLGQRSGHARK